MYDSTDPTAVSTDQLMDMLAICSRPGIKGVEQIPEIKRQKLRGLTLAIGELEKRIKSNVQ